MATWSTRLAGGAERYIEQSIDALHAAGVAVALLAEGDEPAERAPIAVPDGTPVWTGGREALAAARGWRPTLVLDHGLNDGSLAASLRTLAPTAHVTHNYLGACISGQKTHKSITPRTCERTLGWPCLLHYYPNHCGGFDPRTMMRLWRRNRDQLALIRRSAGVLAYSRHMAEEFVRHGISRENVRVAPPPIAAPSAAVASPPRAGEPWRIAFLGRFDVTKGAGVLIDAMPQAARRLGVPLHLSLVGDGPERAALERHAARVRSDGVSIAFTGWLSRDRVDREVAGHHLLVMPSLWPEPFGLVGLEAGAIGLPAVAFDVGGIPDWLEDGVAGVLVRGVPRAANRLADGIAAALRDVDTWRALSAGARRAAQRHSAERFRQSLVDAVTAWQRAPGAVPSVVGVGMGDDG